METFRYQVENDLSVEDFISVLEKSTLAERRPVQDKGRIEKMLRNANLIVTARDATGALVGVSRSLSDFSFCTYLSDMAVDKAYQGVGIGKELIRKTQEAAPEAMIILLAAPKAIHYYPKIGMPQHEYCFTLSPNERIID